MRKYLTAAIVLLLGRGRPTRRVRVLPEQPQHRSAERAALVLLLLGSLFAVAFIVVYAVDSLPARTQLPADYAASLAQRNAALKRGERDSIAPWTAQVAIAYGPNQPSDLLLPVVPGIGVPTGLPPCPGLRGEPCREYRPLANRTAAR